MLFHSTGTVAPAELFAYFEVEATRFERAVFVLFDEGIEFWRMITFACKF